MTQASTFETFADALEYIHSGRQVDPVIRFRPTGEKIDTLIHEAEKLLEQDQVKRVYIDLWVDMYLDEEDMKSFRRAPPLDLVKDPDEHKTLDEQDVETLNSDIGKLDHVFSTAKVKLDLDDGDTGQISSAIIFNTQKGRLIIPYGATFDALWWQSDFTPDIDPYLLDISAASGMSPGDLWRHRPMTKDEKEEYERWHGEHKDERKDSSDIDVCMSYFRNDHTFRKSELVKQLERLAIGAIKRVCKDLRGCSLKHFNGERVQGGGTRVHEPELYASFVQIIAQSYLLMESGKNKRYQMQKMWARAMKTKAHFVADFLGAEVRGDELRMNYEKLRKQKRLRKRNRYF